MGRLPNIVMSLKNFWTTHKKFFNDFHESKVGRDSRQSFAHCGKSYSDICHILVVHKMSNFSRVKNVNFEFSRQIIYFFVQKNDGLPQCDELCSRRIYEF